MPRKCSVCVHSQRSGIEQALLSGDSYRVVAQRWSVSRDAVVRHRRHLATPLGRVQEARDALQASSLLDQLHGLTSEAERLKRKAEDDADYRTALAAVRELC